MSGGLTDAERLVVLSPCACGHDINDHGELAGCWSCPDQGDECSVSFESMLAERVARIKADAIAIATADQRDRMVDMERQRNYWRDQAGRLTLRLRAVPAQPANTKAADQ